jgi:HEPN domain-containing protein
MRDARLYKEWRKQGNSNFERAKSGRTNNEIMYEDLCFDCQQAVE